MELSNLSYYSNTVAVDGAGGHNVSLWPNPTPDKFHLIVSPPMAISIVIFNKLSQQFLRTTINAHAQTYLEEKNHNLIPGTY